MEFHRELMNVCRIIKNPRLWNRGLGGLPAKGKEWQAWDCKLQRLLLFVNNISAPIPAILLFDDFQVVQLA